MSSLLEAPAISGEIALGTRKTRRMHETTEIRIRSTHRRRKVLTRAGVLAGFALAMVVYPVFGTIAPYADAAEYIPGVVKGEAPTTAAALLGGGPQLKSSDLPAPEAAEALLVSTPNVEETIPDCDASVEVTGSNGRLDYDALCPIWTSGERLQPAAATALVAMNDRFNQKFGRDMCVSDTYRSLQQQYRTKALRGYLAAPPGTSLHGWGIAIDICTQELRGETGQWIRANSDSFGWGNPDWAKGSKYEPWHYEYVPMASEYYSTTWGVNNY